jgi:hypothetical protein
VQLAGFRFGHDAVEAAARVPVNFSAICVLDVADARADRVS